MTRICVISFFYLHFNNMIMQHGEIGFCLDVFSLGFIGIIVGMAAIICVGRQSAPALGVTVIDLEYCAVAIVCAGSFVFGGTNMMDYENAVLVTGGCVLYFILRQPFVKVVSSSLEGITGRNHSFFFGDKYCRTNPPTPFNRV
jgi:hypothetical protein